MMMRVIVARGLGMVVMGGEHGGDRFHPFDPQNHGFADLAQRLGLWAAIGGNFQHKADMAILDHQALDHVLLDHGAPARRIDHLVKRFQNLFAGDTHGGDIALDPGKS